MAYLVRKLNKRDKLSELEGISDISGLVADIPTAEFRTTNGSLSTWIIESLDSLGEAVLAIVITSSEITKMDFIVIDTDILSSNGLEYKQTYAGQDIAIPDLQNTHYDIINISVGKLLNCTQVYHAIVNMDPDGERYIMRFTAGEIKDLLKEALLEKRVDVSRIPKKIKAEIDKMVIPTN